MYVCLLQIKPGQDPEGAHIWGRAGSLLESRSGNQVLVERIMQMETAGTGGTF